MNELDTTSVRVLAEKLFRYEKEIHKFFEKERKRKPEIADKTKKIFEEEGEFIKALAGHTPKQLRSLVDLGERQHVIEEIVDTAFAALSQALVLEYTSDELAMAILDVLDKLEKRWGKNGTRRENWQL